MRLGREREGGGERGRQADVEGKNGGERGFSGSGKTRGTNPALVFTGFH